MPVFCNVLWDDRAGAVSCDRGDIMLAFCEGCSFMFNTVFDPELVRYSQSYDNCLHFSERFRRYADTLSDQLIDRHGLHNKLVVDVGCGKGDFLKLLCEKGPNRGMGFDPSFEKRSDIEALGGKVTIVDDYYTEKYAGHGGDFLCCRHVLEHVELPGDLLVQVRGGLGERSGIPVFFEVPNGAYTVENVFVWDVIYEHPCYFTSESLARLFGTIGFAVTSVSEEFEGQYLGLHATTGEGEVGDGVGSREKMGGLIDRFTRSFNDLISRWRAELDSIEKERRRAVIWGAGSKGVTFLNLLDRGGRIAHAVDISPNKHGKFIAGTGQEIVSPDFLVGYDPDDVLVMNPVYEREISSQLREMGIDARVRSL
jgi:SAM-dependent methyltransferase